jgi:Xaa-Pro aminopeptidase
MRRVKTEHEMRLIKKAVEASVEAHLASWRVLRPGGYERNVAAEMARVLIDAGCLRPAYAPIIGSGPNSAVLHYSSLGRRIEGGELVLIDVGGEYAHYAADITRTLPAGGNYGKRQRALYDIVLEAQRRVLAAVRPGMTLEGEDVNSLGRIARDYFREHDVADRFPHGVGHYVGLDVHDPGSQHDPLREGMVITVEPGLYFPEEGMGIRIEDMVLVTKEGGRVLSADLPKDPDEIERLLRR